jgi:hypothetical protein
MNSKGELHRCQSVLVTHMPAEVAKYYDNLQKDHHDYLPQMILWGGNGFMEMTSDKTFAVVTPEESRRRCLELYQGNEKLVDLLPKAMEDSSFHGLFYPEYKSRNVARRQGERYKLLQGFATMCDEDYAKAVKFLTSNVKDTSKELWDSCRYRLQNGEKVDVIWRELSPYLKGDVISQINNIHKFTCRDSSYGYTTALKAMLVADYSGWKEINTQRCDLILEMRERFEEYRNKVPVLYTLMCELDAEMTNQNYGLTKRIFYKSKKSINSSNSPYMPVILTLRQVKYLPLLEATKEDLAIAVSAWDLGIMLKWRMPYIRFLTSRKDYPVPFGLTGTGHKWGVTVSPKGGLEFTIPGLTNQRVRTAPSDYFFSPEVTPCKNGYNFSFCHRLKIRKKGNSLRPCSERFQTTIREFGLLKRKDRFYIRISYEMVVPERQVQLQRFFRSSDPLKTDKDRATFARLFDTPVRVAAFDTNISDPLVVAKAEIARDEGHGPLKVLDFGTGKLLESRIVCSDTSFARGIAKFTSACRKLRDVIREYKSVCKKQAEGYPLFTKLSEGSQVFLRNISKNKSDNTRMLIQTAVHRLRTFLRKYHYKVWLTGYRELSEAIRILDFTDQYAYLTSSYNNLHIPPGSKESVYSKRLVSGKDSRRQRMRKHISRLLAARAIREAKDCDLIFFEDIDAGFEEGGKNSISKLFAAGQWKEAVEQAAEKAGKVVVFVSPDGTSKIDPVTGLCGVRRADVKQQEFSGIPVDKSKCYIERDSGVGVINSDVMAAINVLLVGLAHSVGVYKFYVSKGQVKSSGVRLQRFLNLNFGTTKVSFYEEDGKITTAGGKPYTGLVYVDGGELVSLDIRQKRQKDLAEKIKDLLMSGKKIPGFDVTPDSHTTLRAFIAKLSA